MIILIILIAAIFIGLLLSGVLAPVIMLANRRKLAEMKTLIKDFESINPDYRASKRGEYREKLRALKRKVWIGDKASAMDARDLMDDFERIPEKA